MSLIELGYSYTSDLNIWYNYSILVELFDHIYVLSDESFVLEGDESIQCILIYKHNKNKRKDYIMSGGKGRKQNRMEVGSI